MLRLRTLVAIVAVSCFAGTAAARVAPEDVLDVHPGIAPELLDALGLIRQADGYLAWSDATRALVAERALGTFDAAAPSPAGSMRWVALGDLPEIPFPLLPDGGLLFGLQLSEDVVPYRGALLFAREAAPARAAADITPPLDLKASQGMVPAPAPSGGMPFVPDGAGRSRTQATTIATPERASPLVIAATTGVTAATLLTLLGFALYHRIRANSALENDTRKSIFDAVCQNPGLGVHTIAELAGVSYSTATYHLERLVAAGMLVMTPDGNKLCYYKNGGAFTETERRILPLVKNSEATRLLEAILESPGTYRAALAERLGVTATTINWHLRRLREAGLVHETRQGRNAYLYANAEAIKTSIASLALKLDATDVEVAERLRRYVSTTGGAAASN